MAGQQGQSQWRLIWREFRKRKLAVASAGVIAILMLTSIWAPFLANDRPLYYEGVNRFRYSASLRTIEGALVRLANHRRSNPGETEPDDAGRALKSNLPLLSSSLGSDDARRFQAWLDELQTARAETDAAAAAKQLSMLRRRLTQEFDATKVAVISRTSWPVFASLTWIDIFFMAWSITTILFQTWRRVTMRFPRPAQRQLAGWAVWLGLPLLASLGWRLAVPERQDPTPFKQGVLTKNLDANKAPVEYSSVVWPPIPFGLAESVLEHDYQPPPWWNPLGRMLGGLWGTNEGTEPDSTKRTAEPTPWDTPHWLGTDSLGRDVLSRMIWGGRVSLSVGIVSVAIYVFLGIVIGALAGFFRGYVDLAISRFIEVVICFPAFFLILTIVALRGPSIWNIMVVIGLTGWTGIARLIRAEFLRLVDQEFVLAGRALGYSPARLIFRHVLPNAMAPVLVSASFGVAGAILTESALSYLNLGITIPIPSWGSLLLDGRNSEGVAPWLIFLPGLIIFATITCYNLVGEALRDASDPRLRGSR